MTIQQIRMSLNESLTLKMFKKQNKTYNCLITWSGCLFLLCFLHTEGKEEQSDGSSVQFYKYT